MFDPDMVERLNLSESGKFHGRFVDERDYDSLLSMYRDLKTKSVGVNRPWPEFKKDLRSEGKSS